MVARDGGGGDDEGDGGGPNDEQHLLYELHVQLDGASLVL